MFRTEDLELLASLIPRLLLVCFHCAHHILLPVTVQSAPPTDQIIDIEHRKICYESDEDDGDDQGYIGELVVDTPH